MEDLSADQLRKEVGALLNKFKIKESVIMIQSNEENEEVIIGAKGSLKFLCFCSKITERIANKELMRADKRHNADPRNICSEEGDHE